MTGCIAVSVFVQNLRRAGLSKILYSHHIWFQGETNNSVQKVHKRIHEISHGFLFFLSSVFQMDFLQSLLPLVSSLPCYVFCICQQIKIQMQISWVGRSTTHLLENSWDILISLPFPDGHSFSAQFLSKIKLFCCASPNFFASCTFSKFCVFHIPTVGLYQTQYCRCCCWYPCCWGGRWNNFGSNGNLEIWLFAHMIHLLQKIWE